MEPGSVAEAIELTVSACTDPGRRRKENQDHFLVADLSVPAGDGGLLVQADEPPEEGAPSARVRLGPRGLLALVADGMGGAAGGRVASQLAVAWTYRELLARWATGAIAGAEAFPSALRAAVETANARVHDQGLRTPDLAGMGSTMTAVGLVGSELHIAQVGDSRAYLLRDGKANQLTRDQSLVQHLVDAGAMTPEQAATSPHGSVLMQALGTSPGVQVEVSAHGAGPGDVVLLCSDGLFRVVHDDEIAAAAAALPDPGELARALVDLANQRGGPDNVTVVAVRLGANGHPPAPPAP